MASTCSEVPCRIGSSTPIRGTRTVPMMPAPASSNPWYSSSPEAMDSAERLASVENGSTASPKTGCPWIYRPRLYACARRSISDAVEYGHPSIVRDTESDIVRIRCDERACIVAGSNATAMAPMISNVEMQRTTIYFVWPRLFRRTTSETSITFQNGRITNSRDNASGRQTSLRTGSRNDLFRDQNPPHCESLSRHQNPNWRKNRLRHRNFLPCRNPE